MPAAEVRPLDAADLAAVVELERVSQPFPLAAGRLKPALLDRSERLLGIQADGRLLAYAHVSRLPFDAELQSLLVAPGERRQGLAGRLMQAVLGEARGWRSESLQLEVRVGNAGAIRLYRHWGFVEDGRRRDYYPSLDGAGREDALLMSRRMREA
ncbi:GNAT family N-acetyltransferase [Halomonas sp. 18H]|uniref:GNAT family N-acetyltransferase n=1 Tax=Halomonas almeriensis TaxID=308163 RepID=UPI00223044F2|nr:MULTISPECIES: GNAT family N-acetyltransferase [Halomonas]MCW4152497.1 GNAT family N-acetyltransferase [Halomonas sp. 18H]MDN3553927.1 GNAT family N-acetyltransferase [Halomonas almeriensis]